MIVFILAFLFHVLFFFLKKKKKGFLEFVPVVAEYKNKEWYFSFIISSISIIQQTIKQGSGIYQERGGSTNRFLA